MHLYNLALTVPWCITHEALEAMLHIAARDPLPVEESLKRIYGPEMLALRDSKARDDSSTMRMRDGVALISINGPIYRYANFFTSVSGGTTTDTIALDLQKAIDDPNVQAILFVIDSPGGEATGINELAETIYNARGTKPIGAYGEGIVASAAYWIASAADVIGIDATAWVGSIGTVFAVPDPAKQTTTSIQFVSSQSPKKRPDPHTDAGRTYLQGLADRMTDVFVASVARNRGITTDQVTAIEGGMRVGIDAVTAGLVDHLSSEEQMIQLLKDRAQQEKPMDMKSFWGAFWSGAKEAGALEDAPQAVAPAQLMQPEQNSELEALRKQLAAERTARAEQFVQQAVAAGYIVPAQADSVKTLYATLAQDDARDNGARCAAFTKLISERPANSLTIEQLPANAVVLGNKLSQPTAPILSDGEREAVRMAAQRLNGNKEAKR
jgi:ClpP class serine protease